MHCLTRRRYTLYHADLESAIIYSISHEIAQRNVIAGLALNSLHDYIDTLVKYFPGREKTMEFLSELRTWILKHDDAVKGEELSKQVR